MKYRIDKTHTHLHKATQAKAAIHEDALKSLDATHGSYVPLTCARHRSECMCHIAMSCTGDSICIAPMALSRNFSANSSGSGSGSSGASPCRGSRALGAFL